MNKFPFSSIVSIQLLGAFLFAISPAYAADKFEILPGDFTLSGPLASQRILVQEIVDGSIRGQINSDAEVTVEDPSIVRVDNGIATPLADGETTIHVRLGGETDSVRAKVEGIAKSSPWSFRHDVLPVISKVGCNSGACHGALAGKGEFRLSLRGYSAEADYHTIVEEARGRRTEIADPGRSLLLTKPTGAVPHKGGLKFDIDSDEYRIISEWIAQGVSSPNANDPTVDDVRLFPAEVTLQQGATQKFVVMASFSDGTTRDVTRWARFTSTNEPVAQVEEGGTVNVIGSGGGAITAWYSSKIAVARITSPFQNEIAADVYKNAPRNNFIDEMVLDQLQKLRLHPSPRSTDEAFIRRVFLDTIGVLPTPDEVTVFVADTNADKRNQLIDSLMQRPEYVDYWTYQWSDLMLINGKQLRPMAVKAYYDWLRAKVESNTPWNELVREVVVARGTSMENGATNFYALHQDPENMAENISQAFLGLSIACAKCHNHPLEKWTNDQYYGFANLFSRVRAKGWGGDSRNGDGVRTLHLVSTGELVQPLTGKPQLPTPLDGESLDFDYAGDRREHLANWLVAADNPYFSRSITNRIWSKLLGVGLVEEPDDLRVSNAASNDALLQATADYLVEQDFDLKQLIRVILQSETYQRSSEPMPGSENDKRFYSRYYPRRLMAEVLLDAISQVTDVPTDFNVLALSGAGTATTDIYKKGTRALQLYDSSVASYFLKTFGRNDREITCECQRSNEPSMVQVLHLSNGDTMNQKLTATGNRISQLLGEKEPVERQVEKPTENEDANKEAKQKEEEKKDEDDKPAAQLTNAELVDQAFLLTVARLPNEKQKQRLIESLEAKTDDNKRILVEDLFWSLMSSREFLFNH